MYKLFTAMAFLLIPTAAVAEQQESPKLSSTCQISPDGALEYRWTIKSTIGGDRLLSVIELIQRSGDRPLTRAIERVSWSRAASTNEKELTILVRPPVKGEERAIEFTGSETTEILIPDSASVSVDEYQIRRDDQVKHVIAIAVLDNGSELNCHVFVVWLSRPSQVEHYQGLMAEVRDHQDKGTPIEELTYGGVLRKPERYFRQYATRNK